MGGPTAPIYYWSASTYAGDPDNAWLADFADGYVYQNDKAWNYCVRAVRTGSCN
jgi:hypothetical protein